MPAVDIEIGTANAGNMITAYVGGASVEACLQDSVDDNYVFAAGFGVSSLWLPQAHGLAVGTTINSLTIHYRGCMNISGGGTVKAYYQRQGDGTATVGSNSISGTYYPNWVDQTETIPAPVGGWDLTELENCEFGLQLNGGGTAATRAQATKVFLRVDYTAPAATFTPHGCFC